MATLSVTIQEEITLNGRDRGNTNTVSVDAVTEMFSRVVTVTNTEQTVLAFQASVAAGSTLVDNSLRYLRITNLDDTYNVDLRIQDTANQKEASFRVGPLESFMLFNDVIDTNEGSDIDGSISLSQIEKISADVPSSSATADIEIFAVST